MIPAVGWIYMELGSPKPVKALRGIILNQLQERESSCRLSWEPGFPSVPISPGACMHNTMQSWSDISKFPGTTRRAAAWSHCSCQGDEPGQSLLLSLCLWCHGAEWAQAQPCCRASCRAASGHLPGKGLTSCPGHWSVTKSLTYHSQ